MKVQEIGEAPVIHALEEEEEALVPWNTLTFKDGKAYPKIQYLPPKNFIVMQHNGDMRAMFPFECVQCPFTYREYIDKIKKYNKKDTTLKMISIYLFFEDVEHWK